MHLHAPPPRRPSLLLLLLEVAQSCKAAAAAPGCVAAAHASVSGSTPAGIRLKDQDHLFDRSVFPQGSPQAPRMLTWALPTGAGTDATGLGSVREVLVLIEAGMARLHTSCHQVLLSTMPALPACRESQMSQLVQGSKGHVMCRGHAPSLAAYWLKPPGSLEAPTCTHGTLDMALYGTPKALHASCPNLCHPLRLTEHVRREAAECSATQESVAPHETK